MRNTKARLEAKRKELRKDEYPGEVITTSVGFLRRQVKREPLGSLGEASPQNHQS